MSHPVPLIAIDGPAASGKSSTARAVAEQLGLVHIDSGALYRAVTLLANRAGARTEPEVVAAAESGAVDLAPSGTTLAVTLGGRPAEPAIRAPAVTARVSEVAAMPAVRTWVNARLRAAVTACGGGVMDGRDIGTVVFPDAALKVFLTASPAVRAGRRLAQDGRGGDAGAVAREAAMLAERDRLDAGRTVAPLRQAPDAEVLDTTALGFAQQVATIVRWAADRGLSRG